MEVLLFLLIVAVVGMAVYWIYLGNRRDRQVVACVNCGNRMTYRRYNEHGGCQQCGSDLYDKVE